MKNIIICCDGTWLDANSSTNVSNIGRIHRIVTLKDEEGHLQLNYYDRGIGTNGKIDSFYGGFTGNGLDQNILEAYDFLMTHYERGDKVFLFGFSRGAYTVRSLAGLIYNVGLLKKEHADRTSEGFNIYRSRLDDDAPLSEKSRTFRKNFSREIDIEFMGVFDTVGALGIPPCYDKMEKYQFHDTTLNPRILCARQVYAIDEKRYHFMPTPLGRNGVTDIVECAIPGDHSDIGGGHKDSHGLADIALQWMIHEAEKKGLSINWNLYPTFNPDPKAVLHDSYKGLKNTILGYHERHICDKPAGHFFRPSHSWFRASKYPIEPGTKPRQAKCPNHNLRIHPSFFARRMQMEDYNPDNVELTGDSNHQEGKTLNASVDRLSY